MTCPLRVFEGFDVHAAARRRRRRGARAADPSLYSAPPWRSTDSPLSREGNVVYCVKYARGNRTHRIMDPVQFLARLAALIPPTRCPLVRYHGVRAPDSSPRAAPGARGRNRGGGQLGRVRAAFAVTEGAVRGARWPTTPSASAWSRRRSHNGEPTHSPYISVMVCRNRAATAASRRSMALPRRSLLMVRI